MKKLFVLWIVLSCSLCVNAQKNGICIGIQGGYMGFADDIATPEVGVFLTAYNIYVDFGIWPYIDNGSKKNGDWDGQSGMMAHAGYRINLGKGFSVIPMAGYAVTKNHQSDEMKRAWGTMMGKEKNERFDYGVGGEYRVKNMIIHATVTRMAIFGGIGIVI